MQFWKIYLDTCCLSRLFDPPTQARVIQEARAIRQILAYFSKRHWHWVASDVLLNEVNRTPDLEERSQVKVLLTLAHQTIRVGEREGLRGLQLELLGFKEQDALHLACAESGEADIFLTTDDRLLSRAQRYHERLPCSSRKP